MAFEAYLQQGTVPASRGRRITYTVSIVVHAAAIFGAVAYSFWHVEELTPPRVSVTFVSAAAVPPPPPPPPPLGAGSAAPKHKSLSRPKIEAVPKTPDVVQPKLTPTPVVEPPKEAPKESTPTAVKEQPAGAASNDGTGAGKPGGVTGGSANGVKGGVSGGTATTAVAAVKILPPQMGAQQKLSGGEPDFPTYLRQPGVSYLVLAKISVGVSGAVDSVVVLKHGHPTLDNNVVVTVKTWKFKPWMANGTPVPYAFVGRFEFKSE